MEGTVKHPSLANRLKLGFLPVTIPVSGFSRGSSVISITGAVSEVFREDSSGVGVAI